MTLLPFTFSQLSHQTAALGLSLAVWVLPFSAQAITPIVAADQHSTDVETLKTLKIPAKPVLVAELYDLCDPEESTYLVAETENYWVSICGGDAPYTYVGMDKNTGSSLEVSLSDYAEDGSWFEAVNGDYTYLVIFGTAKGHFLTVMEGEQTILQEYLVDWE